MSKMKEAMFYEKKDGKRTHCHLCLHNCLISDSKTGKCGVRRNNSGVLYSLVYGKLCSISVDPIEKKPLFHFAPGTQCLSISTVGCNLSCSFCQNWEISHPKDGMIVGQDFSPEKVIAMAIQHDLPGIAYTYTEPTIAWEYYFEIMKLARKQGLYNVWVSNGYINPEPAGKIAKYMDAINVDLKGDVKFYKKLCGIPDEEPTKETSGRSPEQSICKSLQIYKKAGVWIEVTNLIIPGFNDKTEQIRKLCEWIRDNLGIETPIHFSRFFPHYKMQDVGPTPVDTIENAAEAAKKTGMKYVYIGNVPGHELSG